jgi:hypothetical protein
MINNFPELVNHRAAVPRLTIFPDKEQGLAQISAMIPDGNGRYASRQVRRTIPDTKVPEILALYRDDPEGTLENLFEISLTISEPSDAELLQGLRASQKPEPTTRPKQQQITSIEL